MANLGQKLVEARNRKGISIREASESTKIRGDYLTRFESDDFDVNLPPVYLRGFLTNYARYLDLDPEGILADFDALQPADKRRPKKGFGAITVDVPIEESSGGDAPTKAKQPLEDEAVFPWVKVGLSLGGMLIATIVTVLVVQQCAPEDPPPAKNSTSPVVDPNVPNETPTTPNGVRVLKLIVTGPIDLFYVTSEAGGQQVFRNLKQGDERELKFKNSFNGGATSIENLKFEIDGKIFGFEGKGSLNFSWPTQPATGD
ncbi:MAG: helix-turn-helix transcriptional regulator [Opitutales bacterium]